jgi:hypothetical protein
LVPLLQFWDREELEFMCPYVITFWSPRCLM